MSVKRSGVRLALVLAVFLSASALGTATAGAVGLDDYLWERRPLLVFAPTEGDPRLLETLARIEASRCEFADRDMVLGLVVTEGTSTLDSQVVTAEESRQLADEYGVGDNAFAVALIGKDGGKKLRVDEVPDLRRIYAVIDGMPMRGRETSAASRC
jgi:hypothetical protein